MEPPGFGPRGSSGQGLWPQEALPHSEQSSLVPSTSLLVKFPNLPEPQFLTLVKRVCDLIGLLRISPEITGLAPKNALQIQVSYAPHKLPWTPLVFSGFLSTLQLCAACSGWSRGGQLNQAHRSIARHKISPEDIPHYSHDAASSRDTAAPGGRLPTP